MFQFTYFMERDLFKEYIKASEPTKRDKRQFQRDKEKSDIETIKLDIEGLKPDIEKVFQPKTVGHVKKFMETFTRSTIFRKADVMQVISIKAFRASDLLKNMEEKGIIELVSGQ